MARDVFKTAEQGKELLSERRQMNSLEYIEIAKLYYDHPLNQNRIYETISTAFYFGVALGYRQATADLKRR